MPKEERKKGTHLTWDDRHEIQKGLKEHRTFNEIAYIIGCSPDTVSKEIRRHRYHKLRSRDGILHASQNRCKYRNSCRRWDVCKKKDIIIQTILILLRKTKAYEWYRWTQWKEIKAANYFIRCYGRKTI